VGSNFGSSFAQNGIRRVICWGCGSEGVFLSEYINEESIHFFNYGCQREK
jgi:hypothetical protein